MSESETESDELTAGTDHEPVFRTESVDDLDELLKRAANWAESAPTGKVVAEEIRDGRRFVQEIKEGWVCDECGERSSTCSKGGTDLCNECAGLTLEASD